MDDDLELPEVRLDGDVEDFEAEINLVLPQYIFKPINLVVDKFTNEQLLRVVQMCIGLKITIEEFDCIDSPNLTDIPNELTNCTSFSLENTGVKELPYLPNAKKVFVENNQLTSIGQLPSCEHLNCKVNKLKVLPNLPNCLTLHCEDNLLTRLPNIPKLKRLFCSNNNIMFLPNLPKVDWIVCDNNMIKHVGKINNVITRLDISNNPKDGSYKLDCDKILKDNPTIVELNCDRESKPKAVPFTSIPEKFVEVEPMTKGSQKSQEQKIAEDEFVDFVNSQNVSNQDSLREAAQILYDALENEDYSISEVIELINSDRRIIKMLHMEKIFKFMLKNLNVHQVYVKQIQTLLNVVGERIKKFETSRAKMELKHPNIEKVLPYLRTTGRLPTEVETYTAMRPAYIELMTIQKRQNKKKEILNNLSQYMRLLPLFQEEMGERMIDLDNPEDKKLFANFIYEKLFETPESRRQRLQ